MNGVLGVDQVVEYVYYTYAMCLTLHVGLISRTNVDSEITKNDMCSCHDAKTEKINFFINVQETCARSILSYQNKERLKQGVKCMLWTQYQIKKKS